jgi:hypothetical protein
MMGGGSHRSRGFRERRGGGVKPKPETHEKRGAVGSCRDLLRFRGTSSSPSLVRFGFTAHERNAFRLPKRITHERRGVQSITLAIRETSDRKHGVTSRGPGGCIGASG